MDRKISGMETSNDIETEYASIKKAIHKIAAENLEQYVPRTEQKK